MFETPLKDYHDDTQVYKSTDRVIINVGGTKHECYISTIQNFPDTRLYWIAETALKMADFDPEGNEFFFDRHPGCFQNILNYCRTGKLHCPNDVCGPLFEEELAFWGVSELMMEPCCWGYYTQHREASKNLKIIDELYDHSHTNKYMGNQKQTRIDRLRGVIWLALEHPHSSMGSKMIAALTISVIIASMVTFCLETLTSFKHMQNIFDGLEIFYCLFFTIEFCLRFFCCPSLKRFSRNILTWIDFLSTIQFYFGFIIQMETFDFISMFRLLRCFRLIRFFKDLTGMIVIGQTLKSSARELVLLAMIFFVPMMIFSTMVYYAEQSLNDEQFTSIPASFWWAIITLSTVGYGDVVPKSISGKIIGAACSYFGVLMVALPISVIGNNFSVYYSYAQARMRLPKRQENFLLSADKALFNGAENNEGSISSEKTMSPEIEMPKRTRRHAIRNSFGPISNLQKNQKEGQPRRKDLSQTIPFFKKESLKNGGFENSTRSLAKFTNSSRSLAKFDTSSRSLARSDKNSVRSLANTDNGEANFLLPKVEIESDTSSPQPSSRNRSVTVTPDSPQRIDNNMRALSKSQDNLLDSPGIRKRVLHLDITSYQPQKISLEAHEQRRRISQYHPAQTFIREESTTTTTTKEHLQVLSTDNKRKSSTLKSVRSKGDLVLWLEENSRSVSPYSERI